MKKLALSLLLSSLAAVAAPLPFGNGCNGTCIKTCELPLEARVCSGSIRVNGYVLSCREDRPLNTQLFWRRIDNGLGYYYPPAVPCVSDVACQ